MRGKDYWRSLDELADTPEFREFLEREFPQGASELDNSMSRRNFLTLMGASMALAGLASCRRPINKIIPYVRPPEEVIPGVANHYATTMPLGTSAYGLIVESHEGRPTKIEGNPDHPSTMGMSNVFLQASILGLYDPDRSKEVLYDDVGSSWADFIGAWKELHEKFSASDGDGLAVLSESSTSPSLSRLVAEFKQKFPKAKWAAYEPISDENIYKGVEIASGQTLRPVYHFEKAKVILSLDSDFLYTESESITSAKGFTDGRRIENEKDDMNRLYVVESAYSITGGMADHRMQLRSRLIGSFTAALLRELKSQGLDLDGILPDISFFTAPDLDLRWIRAVAKDLVKNKGQSLVVAGRGQPAGVHAMVYAINYALGNAGNSVEYRPAGELIRSRRSDFENLVSDMRDGKIDTLVILGGNPIYNCFADLEFRFALDKVKNSIHLSGYVDETSNESSWHIPETHYLEAWGDAVSANGTRSVVQPLIAPLFDGHSALELTHLLATGEEKGGYDIVRDTWKDFLPADDFERRWEEVLHDGFLRGDTDSMVRTDLKPESINEYLRRNIPSFLSANVKDMEVVFRESRAVHDGRFANNGWLQELPDSVTKLTWDNAVIVSPDTASKLEVENEDVVILEYGGRSMEAPIWIVPGQTDNSITLTLGYGRESSGRVGSGVGFDFYMLRQSSSPYFDTGAIITGTGRKNMLANTQDHGTMAGRPLVREATLDEYRLEPFFAPEMVEHPPLKNLWKEHTYDEGYQWGMTIDLNVCIGCNACTTACQSENNIPVVGKEQVAKGREMHWIRVDRYFTGEPENAGMAHQPVPCQQCENAPCEQVCPVAATVHDHEGLNVQVYNRCIGTRYCSNNCPYKVRRFNFFNLTGNTPEVEKMAQNPDVTVRSRGVMEKCSYCVQRINEARLKSKSEGRSIRDGEVVTACQQSCPTGAIVFGNINEPDSRVSKMKSQNRNYSILEGLNTRPRTSYLARIRNPNAEIGDKEENKS